MPSITIRGKEPVDFVRESRANMRAYVRIVSIILFTLVLFVPFIISLPLRPLFRNAFQPWQRWIHRFWGQTVARIIGMRVHKVGTVPKRPYFMVANHLSWVDIPALVSLTSCSFVAMAEMSKWPVWGFIIRCMGTIFIDRKSIRDTKRVNEEIWLKMERGEGLVVFVESTTSHGDHVLPFKPALLEPAAAGDLPVYCATITYDTPKGVAPPCENVHWVEDIPFSEHLMNLLRVSHFSAVVVFSEEPIRANDRKVLAKLAEDKVASQLPEWRTGSGTR